MKKIILIAAIAVCSISSYAQVSFGAQVGANIGMSHQTNDDPVYNAVSIANDPKVGFMVGVLAQVDFGKLAFRPELNFIQKGSKLGATAYGYGGTTEKVTLNYVEVPLNVVYNLEVGNAGKVFFGLGPAIGIGISGNDKASGSDKVKIKFDGDKDATDNDIHLKRMDIGANVLAGFQLKMGAFAKIGYTYGFSDIDPIDNLKYKNRGFSICLGYMFGGNSEKKK